MEWSQRAREAIAEVQRTRPELMSLPERTRAIDATYPFGLRKYGPTRRGLKPRSNTFGTMAITV